MGGRPAHAYDAGMDAMTAAAFPPPDRLLPTPDGASLAFYRLGREGAPPLLWGHANGFATAGCRQLLQRLAQDFAVFAWDARGHGASTLPALPMSEAVSLDRLAADAALVGETVAALAGRRPHVAAHSFAGVAVLLAAQQGAVWASATLFEPPLATRAVLEGPDGRAGLQQRIEETLARRRRWRGPDHLYERLRGHPAYARIADAVLADHAAALLVQDAESWVLRCTPETEAAIYRNVSDSRVFDSLDHLSLPATFVAAGGPGGDWLRQVQAPAAAALRGRFEVLPDTTHFMPLEAIEACAALIRRQAG